jgi:hypothetical protein
MIKSAPVLGWLITILVFLSSAPERAAAYTFVSPSSVIYTDENGSGYRHLTSMEPSAKEDLPLSNITVYPESDIRGGLDISYTEEEGPGVTGKNATLILHTRILLTP